MPDYMKEEQERFDKHRKNVHNEIERFKSTAQSQLSLPILSSPTNDELINNVEVTFSLSSNVNKEYEQFKYFTAQLEYPKEIVKKFLGCEYSAKVEVLEVDFLEANHLFLFEKNSDSISGFPTEAKTYPAIVTYKCYIYGKIPISREKKANLCFTVQKNTNPNLTLKFEINNRQNIKQFKPLNTEIVCQTKEYKIKDTIINDYNIKNIKISNDSIKNFQWKIQNKKIYISGTPIKSGKCEILIEYSYKLFLQNDPSIYTITFEIEKNENALRLCFSLENNKFTQYESINSVKLNAYNEFIKDFNITDVRPSCLSKLANANLTFDKLTKKLSGFPIESGDFYLDIDYTVIYDNQPYPFSDDSIKFTIDPNEKKLENIVVTNLPSARHLEFYKAKLNIISPLPKPYDCKVQDVTFVNIYNNEFSYNYENEEIIGFPTTKNNIELKITYYYPNLPLKRFFKKNTNISLISNNRKPELEFKLKNAKCDEQFSEALELTTSPLSSIDNYDIIDIDFNEGDIGLFYNSNNKRVEGTPNIGGKNINATVIYTYHKDKLNDPKWQNLVKMKADLKFFVNKNSKTLWNKVIPSDPNEVYWKPDTANDFAKGIEKNIVAGRYRGRSHAIKGTCCDDDFYIKYNLQHDCYIAIVADGAGSAKFSRQASKLAVNTAGNFINSNLNEYIPKIEDIINTYKDPTGFNKIDCHKEIKEILYKLLGGAVTSAHNSIKIEFNSKQDLIKEIKNLSTTLLIAVAKKIRNYWLCAAYWVGDGAIAVYKESTNSVKLLGEVDSGEFSGQTRFLSQKEIDYNDINKRIQYVIVQDDFTAFMLMSDGVSDPKFHMESNLNKVENWKNFWNELNNEVPSLKTPTQQTANDLMEWLNFWSEGEHDDRTLAIIY